MKINRKRLNTILCAAGTVLLAIYMAGAFAYGAVHRQHHVCKGLRVEVRDDAGLRFVTAREIANELGTLPERAAGMLMWDINTERIARNLRKIDKIEDVEVTQTSDSKILIEVTPLIPVARVFDGSRSYYINKDNKRISADARYHMDVPVIAGHFPPSDSVFTPASLLPLIDWLASNKKWSNFVTMIKVDSPRDVILIPAITGHVINIGEPTSLDSKFERLGRMYTEVLPLKGWNYYDTLSVKWGGQVVATRRIKPVAAERSDLDIDEEEADLSTMLAGDGVAPGQTKVGRQAKDDKPIPATVKASDAPNPPVKPTE